MKKWTALLGLAILSCAPGAGAQTLLSSGSVSGSATANATSVDYRYTKHTRSGGGRGGHVVTYYTWDPYTDQQISPTLAMLLNGSSGSATAAGTYYQPTYGASASGTTSLSSAAASAVFTTKYIARTTLSTPQVAHQRVTTSAADSSTFSFTLTDNSSVTIKATGSAGGTLTLYGTLDEGVGGILYLSGPGTTTGTLAPGNYWITSSTGTSAAQDTQLSTFTNLGTTKADYAFTATFTKQAGGG